jgi:hypothetical protein
MSNIFGNGSMGREASTRGSFNPGAKAGCAEVQGKPPIDLIEGLLLGETFHLGESLQDLPADVARQVLGRHLRRRRIGDGFDGDLKEVAGAGLELGQATGAEKWFRIGIGAHLFLLAWPNANDSGGRLPGER